MSEEVLRITLDSISESLNETTESSFIEYFKENLDELSNAGVNTDTLSYFYSDIKTVFNYINEHKNVMVRKCGKSLKLQTFENKNKNLPVPYLTYMHIIIIRYMIEYNYKKDGDSIIDDIVVPISRLEKYEAIYKSMNKLGFSQYAQYLYTKNDFLNQVVKSDFLNLKDEIKNLNSINDKLSSALKNSENISLKFEEYGFSGDSFVDEFKERLQELTLELESGILAKVKVIEDLDKKVNGINDNLTFIGLENAYKLFGNQKRIEKANARKMLKISTPMIFLPMIINFILLFLGTELSPFFYMLTVTATLILLYFFRISLQNYQSIKAELTQINLRRSLCMFIQGYTEFAERNKEHQSLSKFESLMFSNVISDAKQIPATLDGLEQLVKLFEAIKK